MIDVLAVIVGWMVLGPGLLTLGAGCLVRLVMERDE